MSRKVTFATVVACVGLLAIANLASAGTSTWVGTSGAWSDPNNWVPAGVPGLTTDTVFDDSGTTLLVDLQVGPRDANWVFLSAPSKDYELKNGTLNLAKGIDQGLGLVGRTNIISAKVAGTGLAINVRSGTLKLSGENTGIVGGTATVSGGATLQLGGQKALGGGGGGAIVLDSGNLDVAGVYLPYTILDVDLGTAGDPAQAGSSSYAAGVWTVRGGGSDFWDPYDRGHFTYRQIAGDFDVKARAISMTGSTDGWCKYGIMVRDTVDPYSAFAMMCQTLSNGQQMQWRSAYNGGEGNNGTAGNPPYWVRLVRAGNSFSGYRSPDGITWTLQTSTTLTLTQSTLLLGLGVTAHNNTMLAAANFDNVGFFDPILQTSFGNAVTAKGASSMVNNTPGGMTLNMGGLTLDANSVFSVTGSTNFTSLGFTGPAGRSSEFRQVTAGTTTAINGPVNDGNAVTTLIKGGPGILHLNDATGASAMSKLTLKVNEGTLKAVNSATADSLGDAAVIMNGGTLELTGKYAPLRNAMFASLFLASTDTNLNLEDATYQVRLDRTFTGSKGLLSLVPTYKNTQTGELYYDDAQFNRLFPEMPANNSTSNFSTFWTCQFRVPTTGTWGFRGSSDDRSTIFIDTSKDGIFQASERIGANAWDVTGTRSMTVGDVYNIVFAAHEFGGGETAHFWVTPPGGSEQRINPTAQAGWWTINQGSGQPTYGNNVSVLTDSAINVVQGGEANLGALTMANGTKLSLGGSVAFTSTRVAGGGARTAIFDTTVAASTSSLGQTSDEANSLLIEKRGAGTLRLADLGNVLGSTSTVKVSAGKVIVKGSSTNQSLKEAAVVLNGGTIYVEGTADEPIYASFSDWTAKYYDISSLGASPATIYNANIWTCPVLGTRPESQVNWPNGSTPPSPLPGAGATWMALDYVGVWWTSTMTITGPAAGTITFGVNSDDGSGAWVNGTERALYDGDHGFDGAGPRMGAAIAYAPGAYTLEVKDYEWAGGEGCTFHWNTAATGLQLVPVSGTPVQIGLGATALVDLSASSVHVTADSIVDSETSVKFGALEMDAGTKLGILPSSASKYIRFASTSVQSSATFDLTGSMYAGAYSDNDVDTGVVVQGTGTIIFDDLVNEPKDANTSFLVLNGMVGVVRTAAKTPMPGSKFQLDGGAVGFSSADGNALSITNEITLLGNGRVFAGKIGNGSAGPVTITLPNDLDIPDKKILTLDVGAGYTMDATGNLTSSGLGGVVKNGAGTLNIDNADPNANFGMTFWANAGTTYIRDPMRVLVPWCQWAPPTFPPAPPWWPSGPDAWLLNFRWPPTDCVFQNIHGTAIVYYVEPVQILGGEYVTAGSLTVQKDLTAGWVFVSGGTVDLQGPVTTLEAGVTITGGTTTARDTVTTPCVLVTGGTFDAKSTIDANTVIAVTGGELKAAATVTTPLLLITGGKMTLTGDISGVAAIDLGRAATGGELIVDANAALVGAVDFAIHAGGTVTINRPQDYLPVITVETGGLLKGDMTGAIYNSTYVPQNIVFQNKAVFGATAGPEPNTIDLGPDVRLLGAIIGGYQVFNVGDDGDETLIEDIYSGVAYGPWTTSQFKGVITDSSASQTGFDVLMNGMTATLNWEAELNTGNTTKGVNFTGAGRVIIDSSPSGSARTYSRTGPVDGSSLNLEIIRLNAGNALLGEKLIVTNGRLGIATADVIDGTSRVILGQGATLILDSDSYRPSRGTWQVDPGGMVWVNNSNRLTNGATFQWSTGAMLLYRCENFNPAAFNWPTGVTFISDESGYDQWPDPGLRLSNGAYLITRRDGDAYFRNAAAATGGVRAYLGGGVARAPVAGDSIGIAAASVIGGAWWRHSIFEDPMNLTVPAAGGNPEFRLNVVIGNDVPMTTVIGNNNRTRVEGIMMAGQVRMREEFIAGDILIKSGKLWQEMSGAYGTRIWRTGKIVIGKPDGTSTEDQMPTFIMWSDGTTAGETTINGPIEIYKNGYFATRQDARIATNKLRTGTLGTEVIVHNGGGAYFWLASTGNASYANETFPITGAAVSGVIINEKVTVEGAPSSTNRFFYGDDSGRFNDNRAGLSLSVFRDGGGNAYVPNIYVNNTANPGTPATVSMRPDGLTLYASLIFQTDGVTNNLTTGTSGDWRVINARSVGDHTWTVGDMNQDVMVHQVWGQLGDAGGKLTLDLIRGTIEMYNGSKLYDTAEIRNTGIGTGGVGLPDGHIWIYAGRGGDPATYLTTGTFVLGNNQDITLTADDAGSGPGNVNKLAAKIRVLPTNGYLRADIGTGAGGNGVSWFANVQPDAGATVTVGRWDDAYARVDFVMNGDASVRNEFNWVNIGDVTGTGTLTLRGGSAADIHFLLRGQLDGNADIALDRDGGVVRVHGALQDNFDGRFGGSAAPGGFNLGGRTVTLYRTGYYSLEIWPDATDTGPGTFKAVGYDSAGTWNRATIQIRPGMDGLGGRMDADTNYELAGGNLQTLITNHPDTQQLNEVNGTVLVTGMAQAVDGILISASSAGGTIPGKVIYKKVELGTGDPVMEVQANDGTTLVIDSIIATNSGTVRNDNTPDRFFIGGTTGAGTVTLDGSQRTRITGAVTSGGVVFANTQEVMLMAGSSLTAGDAWFRGPVTIDPSVTVDLSGTGYVQTALTLAGNVAAGETWSLDAGGNLIANGKAYLTGANIIFNEGRLTLKENGDSNIPLDLAVGAKSGQLHVDRLDAGGGTGKTLTFTSLVLDGNTLTVTSDNEYKVAFGSTEVKSFGSVVAATRLTDVDLGAVSFTGAAATLQTDAGMDTTITVGPLVGDANALLVFGASSTVTGGSIKLRNSDANTWLGTVLVSSGWLVLEQPLIGYTNLIVDAGLEVRATGVMDMSAWTTKHLMLSAGMDQITTPGGPVTGELVINYPVISANFKSSGGGPLQIKHDDPNVVTMIWSKVSGADYQGNIEILDANKGPVLLGHNAGLGQNFQISGALSGSGSLDKIGAETVTLSGTNSYSGGTTVSAGTLVMANVSALGDSAGAVTVDGGTLQIDVANADFSPGGYGLTLNAGGTVDVTALGADLSGMTGTGTLRLSSSMQGATAPTAPFAGTLEINTPEVHSDFDPNLGDGATISTLSDTKLSGVVTISTGTTTITVPAGSEVVITEIKVKTPTDPNAPAPVVKVEPTDGKLTTDKVESDTGGIVPKLKKAGKGIWFLRGIVKVLEMTIGEPCGWVVVADANAAPTTVMVKAGSVYSGLPVNYPYAELDAVNSSGVLALSANNNQNLSFAGSETLTLGAMVNSTYSGTITPGIQGYMIGGGGATLRLESVLADVGGQTNAQFGWENSSDPENSPLGNDPIPEGIVVIAATNTLTGDIKIYMPVIYDTNTPFPNVDGIGKFVWVYDGGAVDLNDTGASIANIKLAGGSVANTGGVFDANQVALLYPTGDYIIGGPGSGNTGYADGAFVRADANLRKVGTNQCTMLVPGDPNNPLNTYGSDMDPDPNVTVPGFTRIEGGKLTMTDIRSLGGTTTLEIQSGGEMELLAGGSYNGAVRLAGTMRIRDGETFTMAGGSFELTGAATLPSGTLDLGGLSYTGTGTLDIQSGATLKASWSGGQADRALKIRDGAMVEYTGAIDGGASRIGSVYPGGTVLISFDGAMGNVGADFLTFDAEAGEVSEGKPYRIGGTGTVSIAPANLSDRLLRTPTRSDPDPAKVRPVAYIQKIGAGALELGGYGYMPDETNAAQKQYWLVSEGTLAASDTAGSSSTLGATAFTWIYPLADEVGGGASLHQGISKTHLEGIEVESGATLIWRGTQGFLPESTWRALYPSVPDEDGDGFKPGELILKDGATLKGAASNTLTLGFQATDLSIPPALRGTYPCYPTIVGAGTPTVNLGGSMRLRSGLDVASGSGKVNTNVVGGRVEFSGDLPGSLGFDGIAAMNVTGGTAAMYKSHAALATTIGASGRMEMNADANGLNLGGSMFNDGVVQARAGVTDMSGVVIGSTATQYIPGVQGLNGAYYTYNARDGLYEGNSWAVFNRLTDPGTAVEDSIQEFTANHATAITQRLTMAIDFPGGDGVNMFAPAGIQFGTNNFTDDQVALWYGQIIIPTGGNYTFYTGSDDGSLIAIDDEIVLNNNYYQGTTWRGATVTLAAGSHNVLIGFWEAQGGATMYADWESADAGIARQRIPVTAFNTGYMAVTGHITVDAGATLKVGGFDDAGYVTVRGALELAGTYSSSCESLLMADGSTTNVGTGNVYAKSGLLQGSLVGGGGGAKFDSLAISGVSPSANLGGGTLEATAATVGSNFTFQGGAAKFGSLSVSRNVTATLASGSLEAASLALSGTMAVAGGTANVASTTMNNTATMEFNADGTHTMTAIQNNGGLIHATAGVTDLGNAAINSTIITPIYQPGLLEATMQGNPNMNPNPANPSNPANFQTGPRGGYVNSGSPWTDQRTDGSGWGPDDTTVVYNGQIYLPGGQVAFGEQIDDNTYLWVDGVQLLNDTNWNIFTYNSITRPAGWYDFEVRFSNGGGGYGLFESLGFGMRFGAATGNQGDYFRPANTGPTDMSRFRYVIRAEQKGGRILVDANAVLKVGSVSNPDEVTVNGMLMLRAASDMPTYTIGAAGQINLQPGVKLWVKNADPNDPSAVLADVISGFNGGTWDGSGVVTAADPAGVYGIAVTPAAGGGTQAYATIRGDADLDGDCDFFDFLNAKLNFGTAIGATWATSDTDYDGDCDFFDYLTTKGNFGQKITVGGSEGVPEPATLSLLVLGLAGLVLRRNRRK